MYLSYMYVLLLDPARNVRGQRYIKERSGASTHEIPDVPVEWDGETLTFAIHGKEKRRGGGGGCERQTREVKVVY